MWGTRRTCPTGTKSPERLRAYSLGIAERLFESGLQNVGHRVQLGFESNALEDVRALAGPDIPVVDVVHPVVDWAAHRHPKGSLALIGTRATVQSGMYESLMQANGLSVTSRATPLLASAIEEGFHNGTISTAVVEAYFADGWASDRDALVLACTLPTWSRKTYKRSCPRAWSSLTRRKSWRNAWRKC